jgi:arginase
MTKYFAASCKLGQKLAGVDKGAMDILNYIGKKNFGKHINPFNYDKLFEAHMNVKQNNKIVTFGGDHSISMATCAATLAKYDDVHIVWVDAHADINSPISSTSMSTHGMPVNTLLGYSNLMNIPVKANPHKLTYIGLRDIDPAELKILKDNKIKWYSSDHVNTFGVGQIIKNIKSKMSEKTKIHLSIDVDSMDPRVFPCTGTPVPGGISPICLKILRSELDARTVSMDIVEYNPLIHEHENEKCLRIIKSIID